jgi:general secretion pathway protein G
MMVHSLNRRREGFSLIELVIVVVIIGIIAAIAIPRLSRGSSGAADSALAGDLAVLRSAIDLYATEHNGKFPTKDEIADQLTKYSDLAGNTSESRDTTHVFGPYLRRVPPLPVGAKAGKNGIAEADGAEVAWIYDEVNGTIEANCADSETDATGKKYNEY